jgi:hypothetical protein
MQSKSDAQTRRPVIWVILNIWNRRRIFRFVMNFKSEQLSIFIPGKAHRLSMELRVDWLRQWFKVQVAWFEHGNVETTAM